MFDAWSGCCCRAADTGENRPRLCVHRQRVGLSHNRHDWAWRSISQLHPNFKPRAAGSAPRPSLHILILISKRDFSSWARKGLLFLAIVICCLSPEPSMRFVASCSFLLAIVTLQASLHGGQHQQMAFCQEALHFEAKCGACKFMNDL